MPDENNIESTEESTEDNKPAKIPEIAKFKNPPAFQNNNSFRGGNPGNTVNNRQRPGRAANRGR